MSFSKKALSLTILLAILSYSCGANALGKCRKGKGLKGPKSVAFYYHNFPFQTNADTVPSNNNNAFGKTIVFNDPLTIGPDMNSTVVGRAQGIYTYNYDQWGDFFLAWFAITADVVSPRFNGSLTMVGAAGGTQHHRRDMPVVGGTGDFSFATGIASVKTDAVDPNNNYLRLLFSVHLFY